MRQANIISFKDQLTPTLQKALNAMGDKRPVLEAMAGAAVSVAERAFTEEKYRPAPWAPKKDGSAATLKRNPPVLARSLMAMAPSKDMVEVGSDRPYARAQNFGYEPRNLPARPFLPVLQDGSVFAPAEKSIVSAMSAAITKAFK